jgi:uncharacterized protein
MRPLLRLAALLPVALAALAAPAAPVARADSAFFPLAGGSFAQGWSNAALITADNDWAAVPSLTGYRGDGLTGATGADPQELLADGSLTPVSVLANESSPDTLDTGGVAEFDGIANPAVALSGSGTADAPHLLLALDATGRQNIVVSYTLRDLDGSSDDAAQPVALQYRVGGGVDFSNLPAGFVADATEPGAAARTTPVSVTLPIAANNQPQVQLRIITANAAGSDEWVGVDDILVTSDPFDGTIVPCAASDTPISAVQGSGATAAITGTVTVQGVVVGDYEGPSPNLRGFYLQQLEGDGDPATSEGIFVFSGSGNGVTIGQVVQVTGAAAEFQDQTQISAASIEGCGTTAAPAPVEVTLPFPEPVGGVPYLERFEGMLVRLPQTLSVTEHFQLGRFGQVTLSSGGRLRQPTNVTAPGAAALALQATNDRNRIILDDAQNGQNPDPILFGRGGGPLSAANTLRGGDTVTGVVGVLSYTWAGNSASPNAYRVRPVGALGGGVPSFAPANPRPEAAPEVGGSVRVAGMNLLNYFNTFDDGDAATPGCFPSGGDGDCRGAESQAEFDRQWPKTVQAIVGTGADVIGVNELENDGYGPDSSIQDLVNRLNDATAPGTYAFVDADAATGAVGALGSDAIRVAILYKPGRVTPLGTAVLNTGAFGLFAVSGGSSIQRNRPALAQTFADAAGERFTVAVSHLKSKGSGCASNISPVGPDPDAGDGQGNCNLTRTRAAEELAAWLATDPTGSGDADLLIVGDLNSYAKEDPVTALVAAGYTNLIASRLGEGAYSYAFDGQWGYLDHALASLSLAGQVSGVAEWHINADEPNVLDYNINFKSPGQIASLYAADQYRVSDHDPVVVGLRLGEVPLYLPLVGR